MTVRLNILLLLAILEVIVSDTPVMDKLCCLVVKAFDFVLFFRFANRALAIH